jgi:predicted Zn-dependent protease
LGDTPVNLYGDPGCPGLQSASFVVTTASGPSSSVFDNGLPLDPTYWIRRGELAALVQTRHSAGLTGLPATPAVGNLVLDVEQPSGSLPDLIGRTRRGLLLTCLWYIREVDPRRLLLTGLTRDGVYLVENGEVTGAVTNFRFNESPVDLLGRLREVGDTEPTLPREFADWFTRAAMPPVRVADFHMSSVSPAS